VAEHHQCHIGTCAQFETSGLAPTRTPAFGFNTGSVLISALAESLALAALGDLLGGLTAYLAFSGYQTSTMNARPSARSRIRVRGRAIAADQGLSYALIA
jgi:hypothetical protein